MGLYHSLIPSLACSGDRPYIVTTVPKCKTRVKVEQMFGIWKSRFCCIHKSGVCMMFRPERCVVVIVATARPIYCTNIDRRLPAPEIDDAASDIDGDEGVIVNRITATTA